MLCVAATLAVAAERRSIDETLDQSQIRDLSFQHNVVYAVQQKLADMGYDPKGVDGVWGPNTLSALNRYRRDNEMRERRGLDWSVIAHLFGVDYVRWKIDDLASDAEQPRV